MKSHMTVKYTPENKHGDIGGEGPGNRTFYYYPMVLWSPEILEYLEG